MTGLLGGGHAIYLDAATGEARNLDCFVSVPSGSGAPMTHLEVPFGEELVHYAVGASSCAVPGLPAGLAELSRLHGRLPWPALVEPALRLARAGVALPAAHASCLAMLEPVMTMREGARLYAPGGRLLDDGRPARAARSRHCTRAGARRGRALGLLGLDRRRSARARRRARRHLDPLGPRRLPARMVASRRGELRGQAGADARRACGCRRDARPVRSGRRPVVAARRARRRGAWWRTHDEPDRRRRRRQRVRLDVEPRARFRRLGAGARPAPEQHARGDRSRPRAARAGRHGWRA